MLVAVCTVAALAPAPSSAAEQGAQSAGPAVAGRLFTLRAPRDRRFVRDRARVWVRAELKRGVKVRAVLLNGVRERALTRRLRASARALSGGRRLLRVPVGRLKRGRNLVAVVVRRRGRPDSEQVVVDRARRARGLIDKLRIRRRLPAHPEVRLRPDRLRVEMRASLNGHDVSEAFHRGAPLARRVRLSPRDGLRAGRNRLSIRVRSFDGRFQQARRAFFVSRRRPLADAGPDRRVRAGLAVRLNGSRSQPAAGRSRTRLGYRWTVIAKPAGAEPVLTGAGRRRAVLSTDPAHPGRYVTRLRVSSHKGGGVRTTDTTTTTADAQPRVPVETFATAGDADGIALGMTIDCEDPTTGAEPPCFYANPGDDDQLQVLVLDRQTLSVIDSNAYDTSNLSKFKAQMQALATDQGGATCPSYDTDKLVLLALRSGAIVDTTDFADGLDIFNVSADAPHATSTSDCVATRTDPGTAPFSMIAVPGTLSGKAWTNDGLNIGDAATGQAGTTGSLSGFLKEVADDPSAETITVTRGFTFPDAITYETRNDGASATTSSDDTFVLGSDSVPLLPSTGSRNGVSVVSFDAINPKGTLTLEAFVSNADGESDVGMDWSALDAVLGNLMANAPPNGPCTVCGIGIVINGQVGGYESQPFNSAFQSVLARLEKLGLNPDTFARAVNATVANTPSGYGTYSMISADGIGFASSSVIADGTGDTGQDLQVYDGVLTGELRRDADGVLAPIGGDPSGVQQPSTLTPILYGEQGDWLLTPAVADTTACSTDTTGPETNCQATGQDVAFAYVVEQVFGKLFPGDAPELWSGGSSTAGTLAATAQVGSSGRSADTLDGDVCQTDEAPAPVNGSTAVVDAAAVRQVSLVLRNTYASLATTLDGDAIESVTTVPAGAPFTSDDLTCAKNQMIDELAARDQVLTLMLAAQNIENNSQGELAIDLPQIAEDVQTGAMASISKEISAQTQSDTSWWVQMSIDWAPAVAGVINFFKDADPVLEAAYDWVGFYGDAGSTGLDTIVGPPGNPQTLADTYVLLEAQLEQEEIDVEAQVTDVLTAQANGVQRSEEILLSGPVMMAAFNDAAGTTWNFGGQTADVYAAAQNAYLYNVRQMAYEDLWPQVYSAARFNYNAACQAAVGVEACWNATSASWGVPSSDVKSLTTASQPYCGVPYGGQPFPSARTGSPAGLGAGTEYQPVATVAEDGGSAQYLDYVMVESSSISAAQFSKGIYPTVASLDVVQPFFAQPDDDATDPSSESAPGFYAPDFWFQNLATTDVWCNHTDKVGAPVMNIGSIGGWYQDVQESTDVWPTPPFDTDLPCTYTPIGSGSKQRATCIFDGHSHRFTGGVTLNLANLVAALGGDPATSGIWLAGFGGKGASGGTSGGVADGGVGGGGGYAQTYFDDLQALESALGGADVVSYYIGAAGNKGNSDHHAGGGGASTVVGTQNLAASATAPCVLADAAAVNQGGGTVSVPNLSNAGSTCSAQTVTLVAGGGGGGAEADAADDGGAGGTGATAIAAGRTVSAAGGNGHAPLGGHEGIGGNDNAAGGGGRASSDGHGSAAQGGIGGQGAGANDASTVGWINATFVGATTFGGGGGGGTSGDGGYGGGGGGGFGGGGGGGTGGSSKGGGGGGGGGGYAYKGAKPPTSGALVTAAPSTTGRFIVAVDDVDGPSPNGGGLSAQLVSAQHQAVGGARLRVRFGTSTAVMARLVVTGRGARIAATCRVRRAGRHRCGIRLVTGRRGARRPLRRGAYRLRLIVTDALGRRATDTGRLRLYERGR